MEVLRCQLWGRSALIQNEGALLLICVLIGDHLEPNTKSTSHNHHFGILLHES